MDKIRQLIMDKWDVRRTVSRKIEGLILPHIIKNLKEQSRNLDMDVQRSGENVRVLFGVLIRFDTEAEMQRREVIVQRAIASDDGNPLEES